MDKRPCFLFLRLPTAGEAEPRPLPKTLRRNAIARAETTHIMKEKTAPAANNGNGNADQRPALVHTGRLIACELKRQRRPVSWLAEKLYCDRSNVYRLLQKSSLDSNLLLRISNILRCDFFAAYSKAYLHELELKTQTQPPKQNRP